MNEIEFEGKPCPRHPTTYTNLSCNRCGTPICPKCAVLTSVGYRCPDCEYELQSKHYQGRSKDYIDPFQVPLVKPYVTYILIGIIAIIWLLEEVAGGSGSSLVLIRFGATFGSSILAGDVWRLFTAMFLHASPLHFLFNAYALYVLGRDMEAIYKPDRFLFIYLLSGLFGNVASFAYHGIDEFSVGASGAVFGVMGMNAAFFYFHRHRLGQFGQVQMQRTLRLLLINLLIGFSIASINNIAHIGGFVAGCVLGYVFVPRHRPALGKQGNYIQDLGTLPRQWWAVLIAIAVFAGSTWIAMQYWLPSFSSQEAELSSPCAGFESRLRYKSPICDADGGMSLCMGFLPTLSGVHQDNIHLSALNTAVTRQIIVSAGINQGDVTITLTDKTGRETSISVNKPYPDESRLLSSRQTSWLTTNDNDLTITITSHEEKATDICYIVVNAN